MVTLKAIAKGIRPDWSLEQWFQWPPNIFALISLVLQRTGSYKICLIENAWWEDKDWNKNVNNDAAVWRTNCDTGIEEQKMIFKKSKQYRILYRQFMLLKEDWDAKEVDKIDINHLRTLSDTYTDNTSDKEKRLKDFAVALISVLAVADACCVGLGLISQLLAKSRKGSGMFKAVANLLLTTTGSLSTLPKFHGTVLPKMRTPQSGVVIRSLTHHLTFHATEVEVVWRTFPWLNDGKQSLSLMVVPYPEKIHKADFEIVEENYHCVRYFKGKISENINTSFFDALVKEICQKASSNNDVDLLIFPEMSLSEVQYNYLLNKLKDCYHDFSAVGLTENMDKPYCLQLPIIIAGVLHGPVGSDSSFMTPVNNEVRMAVFFDDKWYDITQRKHHRWQLDRNQLLQYGLEGYFPTDRIWFELCSVLQRRLTILAPNGWLAMTALICEDLARQEPVGEVLRGIGPTLLTALLSDGPQLNTRWSARYASVLADDPGTAVLSITSKGMAERSRRPEDTDAKQADGVVIGLWKDMIRGWKELKLEKDKHAMLFTISAKYMQEYTLDGRSDGYTSSVFRMDSIRPKQIKLDIGESKISARQDKERKEHSTGPDGVKYQELDQDKQYLVKSEDFGNWHQIRTLSIMSFAVDTIVDLLALNYKEDKLNRLLAIIFELGEEPMKGGKKNLFNEIKQNIYESLEEPTNSGTAAIGIKFSDKESIRKIIKEGVETIKRLVSSIRSDIEKEPKKNIYRILVSICGENLKSSKDKKVDTAIPMAFLYNLNTKLSSYKTPLELHHEVDGKPGLTPKDAMEITSLIKETLKGMLEAKARAKS